MPSNRRRSLVTSKKYNSTDSVDIKSYKEMEQELFRIREKNNGEESEEEDLHLDLMDMCFYIDKNLSA